jgi:hypothetical protein
MNGKVLSTAFVSGSSSLRRGTWPVLGLTGVARELFEEEAVERGGFVDLFSYLLKQVTSQKCPPLLLLPLQAL